MDSHSLAQMRCLLWPTQHCVSHGPLQCSSPVGEGCPRLCEVEVTVASEAAAAAGVQKQREMGWQSRQMSAAAGSGSGGGGSGGCSKVSCDNAANGASCLRIVQNTLFHAPTPSTSSLVMRMTRGETHCATEAEQGSERQGLHHKYGHDPCEVSEQIRTWSALTYIDLMACRKNSTATCLAAIANDDVNAPVLLQYTAVLRVRAQIMIIKLRTPHANAKKNRT